MSEIRIINQIIQQVLDHKVKSTISDDLVKSLRVGEVINAKLIVSDNKHWLVLENIKIFIPAETVEQWKIQENQRIKLRVTSLKDPIELQIVDKKAIPKDFVKETSKGSQPVVPNDAEKLILEVRKYINKPDVFLPKADVIKSVELTQGKDTTLLNVKNTNNPQTRNNIELPVITTNKVVVNPIIAQSLEKINPDNVQITNTAIKNAQQESKENKIRLPTEITSTLTTTKSVDNLSQQIQSLISNSKSYVKDNQGKNSTPVAPSLTNNVTAKDLHTPTTILESEIDTGITNKINIDKTNPNSSITHHLNINKTSTPVVANQSSESNKVIMSDKTNKISTPVLANQSNESNKVIISDKNINQAPLVKVKQSNTAPINNNSISVNKEQPSQKSPMNIDVTDNKSAAGSKEIQPLKFEIPALLPDKERFPLLAEKISAAYNRHRDIQPLAGADKSLNKLFHQLMRLNQWSNDNRTSRHSDKGVETDRMVSNLKHSLKDLFRYVPQKTAVGSASNIERSIRQSGVFLEKRLVQEQKYQQLPKSEQNTQLSPQLTLHKDIKANLNRVLTTALYNLAKLTSIQISTTNAATSTAAQGTTPTTGTTSETSASAEHKHALELAILRKSTLITNVRNKLSQLTTNNAASSNLKELELITKEVLKNSQAALSKLQLTQLTNLRPETAPQQWVFELPVQNNKDMDMVSIFLKQHEEKEKVLALQKQWSLIMQFDIANIGKLRAKLVWENNKVNVHFLAEKSNTVSLLDDELSYFKERLKNVGLTFDHLSVEEAKLDDLSFQFSKSQKSKENQP